MTARGPSKSASCTAALARSSSVAEFTREFVGEDDGAALGPSGGEAVEMRVELVLASLLAAAIAPSEPAFGAEWQPPGIVTSQSALGEVLAANAQASGAGNARLARRHERWAYVNGSRNIAVLVAVRGADFRTSLELDGLTYTAGRSDGVRWRGDGNGIVHGVSADLQGDAIDRAPRAVFPLDAASCKLAGEAQLPAPAWVVETDPAGDKPAFLYVDKASGSIVREVMRDGKRVVTTAFDRFEALDGALRARHWRVDDGYSYDALDVTVESIELGSVTAADVAFPMRRVLAPVAPLESSVELRSSFFRDRVKLEVKIEGARHWFELDTGTASITVDPGIARRHGGTTLEHAVLPGFAVGPFQLDRASALSIPPFNLDGILGLDFFFGHVVEIDYRHERVRVLSPVDARKVFADPQTAIVVANVDQGLPLVHAGFGLAQGDDFAIDTGSLRLYVMRPFALRFEKEIAAHWTVAGRSFIEHYLEGAIQVQPYTVSRFNFGPAQARDLTVGVQLPTALPDDLAIPFDGIIGTDILRNFDVYFDYDTGRLGVRR